MAAYHGALRIGAVVNPLNVMLTGTEIAFVLSDAGSKVLFASAERLKAVAVELADVEALDLVVSFDRRVTEGCCSRAG